MKLNDLKYILPYLTHLREEKKRIEHSEKYAISSRLTYSYPTFKEYIEARKFNNVLTLKAKKRRITK